MKNLFIVAAILALTACETYKQPWVQRVENIHSWSQTEVVEPFSPPKYGYSYVMNVNQDTKESEWLDMCHF